MLSKRIHNVVAAVDFSDASMEAAAWARAYVCPGANLTLLHVIDLPDRPSFAPETLPSTEHIAAVARENAEMSMRDAVARLGGEAARQKIRIGKPHTEVLGCAEALGADLIVIGPHGDRPRPTRFLGTTADRIVRTSPVPVLVATMPPAGAPKRLLVPVDEIDETERQLAWTHDLAEAFDADVTLLHVWSNAVYSHVASMSYATKHDEAAARADIALELDNAATEWMNRIARMGMPSDRVSVSVTHGKAGDETLDLTEAMKAEMIVLARRTSSLVAPAALGSTIGTVLHGARCPVLVV